MGQPMGPMGQSSYSKHLESRPAPRADRPRVQTFSWGKTPRIQWLSQAKLLRMFPFYSLILCEDVILYCSWVIAWRELVMSTSIDMHVLHQPVAASSHQAGPNSVVESLSQLGFQQKNDGHFNEVHTSKQGMLKISSKLSIYAVAYLESNPFPQH